MHNKPHLTFVGKEESREVDASRVRSSSKLSRYRAYIGILEGGGRAFQSDLGLVDTCSLILGQAQGLVGFRVLVLGSSQGHF